MQRALLERTTGVEPAFDGFAVRTLTVRDHSHMAGVMRFEHTQRGFGDRCSTNWATPLHGASDGNWTRTPSLTPDFKSGASADSATEAYDGKLSYCRTLVLSAGLEPAKYTSWMCRVCQFHHKSIYGSFLCCRWYPRWDLNPQKNWFLRPARMPFRHLDIWRVVQGLNLRHAD